MAYQPIENDGIIGDLHSVALVSIDGSIDCMCFPSSVATAFKETMNFWQGWANRCTYQGRWREMVGRSALTLKLLSSVQHGSFWYVECLARAGDLKKARFLFEKALGYANHLGLYAEELSPCGQHLGNFPQALTHLALTSAAYDLDRRLATAAYPT